MIKNDIINGVGEAASISRQKATQAVETIIEVMRQSLARGDRIELRGFGVFLVKPRKKGIGRNPKKPTDEVQIPPGFTIRFKPGKDLRDMGDGSNVQAARVVLGHVAPTPWLSPEGEAALKGQPANEDSAKKAAEAALRNAKPLSLFISDCFSLIVRF